MNYPTKGAAQWQDPDHWERDRERKGRERDREGWDRETERDREIFREKNLSWIACYWKFYIFIVYRFCIGLHLCYVCMVPSLLTKQWRGHLKKMLLGEWGGVP